MVREYPALGITDVRDVSKNSGNPAFAHPNLCPDRLVKKFQGASSPETAHFVL